MKKWIIVLIVLAIIGIIGRVNKNMSDKMYADCIQAGKQSQETCEYYAYYQ